MKTSLMSYGRPRANELGMKNFSMLGCTTTSFSSPSKEPHPFMG